MSKLPYTYLLILLISPSWYQTIWFGILCSVLTSLVMWIVFRRSLRRVETASHIRFERLVQRLRIALELYDTMLQTIEAGKFVADDALERLNDIAYLRLALKKLSRWLGQATQEGQKVLNLLSTANVEKHDD